MVYNGGQHVAQGTYWDITKGIRIDAVQDSILPGTADKTYIKASVATMLMVSPVFGLLFAVFLPLIVVAMTIGMLLRRVLSGSLDALAGNMSFSWKPLEAYFSGRDKKEDLPKNYRNVTDILDALHGRTIKEEDRKE